MKKIEALNHKDFELLAENISKPTYVFFNETVEKEMIKILKKHPMLKEQLIQVYTWCIFDVLVNVFKDVKFFIEKEKLDVDIKSISKIFSMALYDCFSKEKIDTIN